MKLAKEIKGIIKIIIRSRFSLFTPMGILDILSKVGGMLGLFLGGSLFSIIEIVYHAFLMFSQLTKFVFILCHSFL